MVIKWTNINTLIAAHLKVLIVAAKKDLSLVLKESIHAASHHLPGRWLNARQMEAGKAGPRHLAVVRSSIA